MQGPIATIGSLHVCPMCTGFVPHVGGPVIGPGTPNILVNGKPAAIMGDMCTCVGPPDVIVQGSPSVFFNGVPVACMGCLTAHGGVITLGEVNVVIGTATPVAPVTMAPSLIPFPKITPGDRIKAKIAGQPLKEAEENQKKLTEEEEEDPRIFNLQWIRKRKNENGNEVIHVVRKFTVNEEVMLRAYVQNIGDGTEVTFKIRTPLEEGKEGEMEEVTELKGIVKNKMVEVKWKVEDESMKNQE